MLHTKFRENRPAGSGEEDFLRVFTIYGRGSHLGHVTTYDGRRIHGYTISSPMSQGSGELKT